MGVVREASETAEEEKVLPRGQGAPSANRGTFQTVGGAAFWEWLLGTVVGGIGEVAGLV